MRSGRLACVSSRGAQSTELVSLYIGYWTLNNYYYYYLAAMSISQGPRGVHLLSINEFLSPAKDQHGFRLSHSTTSALLQLTTDIETDFKSLTLKVRDHSDMLFAQYPVNCLEEDNVCHDIVTVKK